MENIIKLVNVTKTFGEVVANKNANLTIQRGEILSLLGENGSGKTTLMNMLSGLYFPDSGEIFYKDKLVHINNPRDAYNYGIGMVHQHFKLIDVFSGVENIILGFDDKFFIQKKKNTTAVKDLVEKYGFNIDINKKVYDMSVSEKQTIEIIKLLYRGVDVLILDEPTAVLTPQETQKLFNVLRNMRDDGKSIIIITHKLQEVISLSNRVAILRKGEIVETIDTKEATEAILADLMVGEHISLNIKRSLPFERKIVLKVDHLTVKNIYGKKMLDDVSFEAYSHEILGVAGVSGSGQKELLEAIAGLDKTSKDSSIIYINEEGKEENLVGKDPKDINKLGVHLAFVPEDRLGMGLVGNMSMSENMLLRTYTDGKSPFLNLKESYSLANKVKEELDVKTPNIKTPVRKLSGGNVQKILVGREIASSPKLLMTAYAVRGLDINTSYAIYNILNDEKVKGTAVIYVGEDLDVLISLCDRILVLCDGKITGIVDARKVNKNLIGQMMSVSEGTGGATNAIG